MILLQNEGDKAKKQHDDLVFQ